MLVIQFELVYKSDIYIFIFVKAANRVHKITLISCKKRVYFSQVEAFYNYGSFNII